MKNRSTLYLACAALGALALAAAPAPQAHDNDHGNGGANGSDLRRFNDLVKTVRQVTDKYHSVAMAENDGYHLLFGCVSNDDVGAMGLHYANANLIFKDPAKGIFDDQIFHYFGAPNRFGLPPFYTLHVWAWKESPTGTFVNWNKDVRCDAHNGPNK